jgi:DNA polymerase III epsilon subunit-like protein
MNSPDQLWIMVDIETSGPLIGTHSMVELGAAVGSKEKGFIDGFEVLIKPIGTAVVASQESFENARKEGVPPERAMKSFANWSARYLKEKALFIARPAAFDWPWIVWYAWTYLGENPFGFKSVCASSWLQAKGRTFKVDLPHRASEDAKIQLNHFFAEG